MKNSEKLLYLRDNIALKIGWREMNSSAKLLADSEAFYNVRIIPIGIPGLVNCYHCGVPGMDLKLSLDASIPGCSDKQSLRFLALWRHTCWSLGACSLYGYGDNWGFMAVLSAIRILLAARAKLHGCTTGSGSATASILSCGYSRLMGFALAMAVDHRDACVAASFQLSPPVHHNELCLHTTWSKYNIQGSVSDIAVCFANSCWCSYCLPCHPCSIIIAKLVCWGAKTWSNWGHSSVIWSRKGPQRTQLENWWPGTVQCIHLWTTCIFSLYLVGQTLIKSVSHCLSSCVLAVILVIKAPL